MLHDLGPFFERCGIPDLKEQLMTGPETAEKFRITETQLVAAAKAGMLPVIRLSFEKGSRYYFRRSEVYTLLEIYAEERLSFWDHFKHLKLMRDFMGRFVSTISSRHLSDKDRETFTEIVINGRAFEEVRAAENLTAERIRQRLKLASELIQLEMDAYIRDIEHVADLEEKCRRLDVENRALKGLSETGPKLENIIKRELSIPSAATNELMGLGISSNLIRPIIHKHKISTLDELVALDAMFIIDTVKGFGRKKMEELAYEVRLLGRRFPGIDHRGQVMKPLAGRRILRARIEELEEKLKEK